jgi:hypothetical protein
MMVPGKIERFAVIWDVNNVKLRDLPIKKLKSLVEIQLILFKSGPYRNVFINMSWATKKILDMVMFWFNDIYKLKNHLASQEDVFQLLLTFQSVYEIE